MGFHCVKTQVHDFNLKKYVFKFERNRERVKGEIKGFEKDKVKISREIDRIQREKMDIEREREREKFEEDSKNIFKIFHSLIDSYICENRSFIYKKDM